MQSGVLSARLVHRCLVKGELSELQRYPGYLQQLGGLHYEGFKHVRPMVFNNPGWLIFLLVV